MVRDFAAPLAEQGSVRYFRVDRFILYPKHWLEYPNRIPLRWRKLKFTERNTAKVPDNKVGVYSFVAEPRIAGHPACSYLLYVGKVQDSDFRTRYKSYLAEKRKSKPRDHILTMIDRWEDHLWFYYAEVADNTTIGGLEDELLIAYLPPQNRAWPAKISQVMRMVFS